MKHYKLERKVITLGLEQEAALNTIDINEYDKIAAIVQHITHIDEFFFSVVRILTDIDISSLGSIGLLYDELNGLRWYM